MSKYPLLPAYVIVETVRALLTFSAVESQIPLSSVLIAFYGEMTKLAVALLFLAKSNNFKMSIIQTELIFSSDWRQYTAISIPAVMYLVNFLLYMFALKLTTPAILHVALLAKLPITALLHHFLVTPQQSFNAWVSLGFITVGMLLFNLPSVAILTGTQLSEFGETYSPSAIGPLIGLLIALVSGFTSTYTEIILKEKIPFWVTQTWLYTFGSLASAMVLCLWDDRGTRISPTTIASISLQSSVVVAVAINGLIVANVLRKNDNLVKLVGSSASIIAIVIAEWVLFSHLQSTPITMQTVAGLGITSISTWTYNYYKQTTKYEDKQYAEERKTSGINGTFFIPSRRKILWSCAAVAQITFLAGLFGPTKPLDLKQQHIPEPITIDVDRFFAPHNITPTPWAPGLNPPRCAWDYIIQNEVTTLSQDILNWEVTYLNSGCPIFPVPDGGLIFHLYWRGPWRAQNDFAIEAFLATQRLRDGHRLIFWYHGEGPPSSTREYFRIYSNYVEFREPDFTAESQGTCLTQMREWTDVSYRDAMDMPVQTVSDMFRTLMLSKYGGIWIDADIILLRDFTSIIRMGPATIGVPDIRDYNNAILIYGPPYGGVGAKVLEVLCKIPYNETEFRRTWPTIRDPYPWSWMYNLALSSICEYHEACGIGLLPAMWTDGMFWGSEGQSMISPCVEEDQFGEGKFPIKFRGLFTLHSRLDDQNDSCVEDGSSTTAGKLRKLVRTMLVEGLDLDGRDIFPRRLWYEY